MARQPLVFVTGNVYAPDGTKVVAGTIDAKLVPPGQRAFDHTYITSNTDGGMGPIDGSFESWTGVNTLTPTAWAVEDGRLFGLGFANGTSSYINGAPIASICFGQPTSIARVQGVAYDWWRESNPDYVRPGGRYSARKQNKTWTWQGSPGDTVHAEAGAYYFGAAVRNVWGFDPGQSYRIQVWCRCASGYTSGNAAMIFVAWAPGILYWKSDNTWAAWDPVDFANNQVITVGCSWVPINRLVTIPPTWVTGAGSFGGYLWIAHNISRDGPNPKSGVVFDEFTVTSWPTTSHFKTGQRHSALITSTVVQSLVLWQTTSLAHPDAYYEVKITATSPRPARWTEFWRVPETFIGTIDVNRIQVLSSTPALRY